MNNIKEMINYLNSINDIYDDQYTDCIDHTWENVKWYEEILKAVLSLDKKPKRVIDVGSNLNQYSYLFENEGIDYIGIDLWNAGRRWKPYESEHVKFIGARYEDIREWFKDDVIISCLCIGCLVDIDDVMAKHLIINGLDGNNAISKIMW